MSAYEIPGFSFSLPSADDNRTGQGQFRFVNVNASGQAADPTLGGPAIGVRQNKPRVGEATTIVCSGIVMVECSAAIVVGANVTCAADGRALTAVATNAIHGRCLTSTDAAGEFATVLLNTARPVV